MQCTAAAAERLIVCCRPSSGPPIPPSVNNSAKAKMFFQFSKTRSTHVDWCKSSLDLEWDLNIQGADDSGRSSKKKLVEKVETEIVSYARINAVDNILFGRLLLLLTLLNYYFITIIMIMYINLFVASDTRYITVAQNPMWTMNVLIMFAFTLTRNFKKTRPTQLSWTTLAEVSTVRVSLVHVLVAKFTKKESVLKKVSVSQYR